MKNRDKFLLMLVCYLSLTYFFNRLMIIIDHYEGFLDIVVQIIIISSIIFMAVSGVLMLKFLYKFIMESVEKESKKTTN